MSFRTGNEVVIPRVKFRAPSGEIGDSSMVEFVGLENCWKMGSCISTGVSMKEYLGLRLMLVVCSCPGDALTTLPSMFLGGPSICGTLDAMLNRTIWRPSDLYDYIRTVLASWT